MLALAQTYAVRRRNGGRLHDAGTRLGAWCSRRLVGAISDRHAVRLGRRDAGQVGFDCSGLVQAAYAVAGVALPRVAQDQYDTTPKLAQGRHCSRATSSSSGAARTPSTTSGFTWVWSADRTSWSMLRIRVRMCVLRPFLRPRARPSGACCSSGRRDRSDGRRLPLPHVAGGYANAIPSESIAVLRGATTGATEGRGLGGGSVVRDRGEGPNGTAGLTEALEPRRALLVAARARRPPRPCRRGERPPLGKRRCPRPTSSPR